MPSGRQKIAEQLPSARCATSCSSSHAIRYRLRFQDALSFEGETGPYIQYAVVRARIFPQGGDDTGSELAKFAGLAKFGASSKRGCRRHLGVVVRAARRTLVLEQCISTSERLISPSTPSS